MCEERERERVRELDLVVWFTRSLTPESSIQEVDIIMFIMELMEAFWSECWMMANKA